MNGTLEGLSLADALRAVGILGKTGVLTVESADKHGTLGVKEGCVAAASCDDNRPHEESALDVIVDMLEWPQGAYSFDGNQHDERHELSRPLPIEDIITRATKRAAEWEIIRECIPNDQVVVEVVAAQDGNVELTRMEWRLACLLGYGCRLDQLLDQAELGRFVGSSVVCHMVKKGLVKVIDDPSAAEVITITERTGRGGKGAQGGKYIKGSLEAVALADDQELPQEWSCYYEWLDGRREEAGRGARIASAKALAH